MRPLAPDTKRQIRSPGKTVRSRTTYNLVLGGVLSSGERRSRLGGERCGGGEARGAGLTGGTRLRGRGALLRLEITQEPAHPDEKDRRGEAARADEPGDEPVQGGPAHEVGRLHAGEGERDRQDGVAEHRHRQPGRPRCRPSKAGRQSENGTIARQARGQRASAMVASSAVNGDSARARASRGPPTSRAGVTRPTQYSTATRRIWRIPSRIARMFQIGRAHV